MSKIETYWQAPLCLLAFGRNVRERLDTMIEWCLVRSARDYARSATREDMAQTLKIVPPGGWPEGVDVGQPLHVGLIYACGFHGYQFIPDHASVDSLIEGSERAGEFIRQHEAVHGASPFMRLRSDLVQEARCGTGITPRELYVYAAVNAAVGCKKAVHVSHSRMRAGAMGYKAGSMLFNSEGWLHDEGQKLLKSRSDGARPLSVSQLRTTLCRLETHGQPPLIASSRPDRWHTYYSVSLCGLELDEKVHFYRTNRAQVRAEINARAVALQKRIAETRAQMKMEKEMEKEMQMEIEAAAA